MIDKNKELCTRYPYLIPRSVWTGEIVDDYDFTWTLADDVEKGWRKLFLQMCEDIREPLIKANYLNKFRFTQIKEKYGTLSCYNNGAPDEVHRIIHKYEYMSQFVCVECGSTDAEEYADGWICPYCPKCAKQRKLHRHVNNGKFKPAFIVTKYLPNGKEIKETIDVSEEWERLNNG